MLETKYTSNISSFLLKFEKNKDRSLSQIGEVGVDSINSETPVLSGNLKSKNNSKVVDDQVVFYNDEEYAPHVELGTINQSANPFMRRGLNKGKLKFIKVLVNNLKA